MAAERCFVKIVLQNGVIELTKAEAMQSVVLREIEEGMLSWPMVQTNSHSAQSLMCQNTRCKTVHLRFSKLYGSAILMRKDLIFDRFMNGWSTTASQSTHTRSSRLRLRRVTYAA